MIDSTKKEIKTINGKLSIVYGEEGNELILPAVTIEIFESENDPRKTLFVSYNGFAMNIPVGKEIVVPEFIYETLKQGNLKNRVSKV